MWGLGSLPLVVVGSTSSFPLMAAATFVVGVTDGAGMVIWGTLLQRRVPPQMLGRVSSLDFFVSLAFMPVSLAIAGPLSKVVSMETIFLAAGADLPVLLGRRRDVGARMRRDELRTSAATRSQTPNIGGSASTMTRPQKKWVSTGASTPPVARRSRAHTAPRMMAAKPSIGLPVGPTSRRRRAPSTPSTGRHFTSAVYSGTAEEHLLGDTVDHRDEHDDQQQGPCWRTAAPA